MKAIAIAVSLIAMTSIARAQEAPVEDPSARARAMFVQGVELAAQERWGEALAYFQISRSILPRPNTVLNIAGIFLRMGRATEAIEEYEAYLADAGASEDAASLEEAQRSLEAARRSVAHLSLTLNQADAIVRVDGRRARGTGLERDVTLDPGIRRVQIELEGYQTEVRRVTVLPGARAPLEITLRPRLEEEDEEGEEVAQPIAIAPPPEAPPLVPSPRDMTAAWAFIGGGAGAVVLGLVLTAIGLVAWQEVESAVDRPWTGDVANVYDRAVIMTPFGATLAIAGGLSLCLGTGLAVGLP